MGRPHARLRPPPPLGADCALFLDIDGTLFDLAATPDRVRPDAEVTALLRSLSNRLGGALALSTGRAITDADRLFPGLRLPIAGQHGNERRTADGAMRRHSPPAQDLVTMRREVERFAARHRGLLLEDKGYTLALHYRLAPRLAPEVHRVLRAQVASNGGAWTLQEGNKLLEIRPSDRDKGTAIADFMVEPPFRGRLPAFVGDDLTDEFGFDSVGKLGGWAIKVGPGRTAAGYRLRDVAAVHRWLATALTLPSPSAATIG
jgi:trehalose 6-phosphate phosphatase